MKIPSLIGHRGVARYAPENTIESIQAAADMGIKWVELDVKLTRDGVPILFHDDTLDRTTNGGGPVATRSFADLQDLEAGSWFSHGFSGIKIPSLEEAVDVLLERRLGVNFEIKPCPGREVETAQAMMDLLSRIWDDRETILISSFSCVSLDVVCDMTPDFPRGMLLDTFWPENWAALADHLTPETINVDAGAITREQVEALIEYGKPILAYTVNEPDQARRLRGWGIDGFFSDAPDLLVDALRSVLH